MKVTNTFSLKKLLLYTVFLSIFWIIYLWTLDFSNGIFHFKNFILTANYQAFFHKPWSIISYSFIHQREKHIVLNTICFVLITVYFRKILSVKRIFILFWGGSLLGGIFFILSKNIHSAEYLLGASAAIMSIFCFASLYGYKNYGKLPIVILLLCVFFDVISLKGNNAGGHFAHLGGVLFGIIFFFQKKIRIPPQKRKSTHTHIQKKIEQQRLQLIQKKISRSGYNSLSPEEKVVINN